MSGKDSLKIGVDTLFESPVTGTGGLVYVRNIMKAIGEISDGEKIYLFTSARNAHLFSGLGPNFCLVRSGWSNESPLLRILSQQVIIPLMARRLNVDVLLCPANVIPLATSLPKVLILQNRLQYNLPIELGLIRRLYRRTMGKLSLHRAAKIIALSHELDQYLQDSMNVPASRRVVIPGGVDQSLFFPKDDKGKRRSDEPWLLVVAQLWPYKNHEVLLRAFARCQQMGNFSGRLVMAGSDWKGRKQQLLSLARELGSEKEIQFLGYIPHEKMPDVYARAKVLLYPSLAECFPLPIFEAMASGVPVIASNCCSLPEVVGDAGICLDPHDEEAWARAIYRVLTDEDFHRFLVEKGLERARSYNWRAAGKEILTVLHEIAQENGAG